VHDARRRNAFSVCLAPWLDFHRRFRSRLAVRVVVVALRVAAPRRANATRDRD
jgi:hypothetical protein